MIHNHYYDMRVARCTQITSDSSLRAVSGYRDPAIEGTTVTFSCPTGLTLTGSNTSTCMRNGEWEPDPKGVKCKGGLTILHVDLFIRKVDGYLCLLQ